MRMSAKEARQRSGLVDLAQVTADRFEKPYRAVVIATDESGVFVGVGSNTSMQDAQNIMKCALYAQGLVFHDVEETEKYSRRGDRRIAAKGRTAEDSKHG